MMQGIRRVREAMNVHFVCRFPRSPADFGSQSLRTRELFEDAPEGVDGSSIALATMIYTRVFLGQPRTARRREKVVR
jgi:hypothetical protein